MHLSEAAADSERLRAEIRELNDALEDAQSAHDMLEALTDRNLTLSEARPLSWHSHDADRVAHSVWKSSKRKLPIWRRCSS
jgi:uncharacterized protein YigA (DUF484 family)